MPLPTPILDDRSFQQLRDELVRRIPVYAPEWTDHNASDPGITLIELFAFLGENLLYRFNQIPDSARMAFLQLLQIPMRPATPASAMLTFTTELADGALVSLGSEAQAGSVPFETENEVHVWPVSALGAAKIKTPAPDEETEPEVYEFAVRTIDAMGLLPEDSRLDYYTTEVIDPEGKGAPVELGKAVDSSLWVAVLKEKGCDPAKLAGAIINICFVPDPVVASIDDVNACPGAGATSRTRAVEWRVSGIALDKDQPAYYPLDVVGDTTTGLSREGVVRLRLPKDLSDVGIPDADPELGGTGDFPPILDDERASKVLFWIRAFRQDKSLFPRVALIAANAAQSVQTTQARPEFLGTGDGQPNRSYTLVNKPVVDGSVQLEVEEVDGWRGWTQVEDFYASTPDDRHFVLDAEAGKVRFGNGEQGRAPQIGERIRVSGYRYGGGIQGNLPPKAISKILGVPGVKKVENPLGSLGGADKETIEAALNRIPGELRRRDRAVTADDFRELALQTPGVQMGRAECLPRFHAPTKTGERAGVVSVVVWPAEDALHPNAPVPDTHMISSVCAWLDVRRLVTTELYVIPPVYHKVAVSVSLSAKPGYGVEAVRRWVELVIRQYLAPLPPYGPSGNGWPLGRRVHGPELEAAALQVEGVEFLESLKVAGWNETTQIWEQGTVVLEPYEVPELTEIAVVSGVPLPEPGTVVAPPDTVVAVPVPILREEC